MCYTLQRIQGTTLGSVFLCVPLISKPSGVTQERANTAGAFYVLFSLNAPPPPAVLASIFYREKGSAVPSLVDNDVEFGQLTKFSAFYRFRPPAMKVRKNTPRRRFIFCGCDIIGSLYEILVHGTPRYFMKHPMGFWYIS